MALTMKVKAGPRLHAVDLDVTPLQTSAKDRKRQRSVQQVITVKATRDPAALRE